jgi:hypothetical protein
MLGSTLRHCLRCQRQNPHGLWYHITLDCHFAQHLAALPVGQILLITSKKPSLTLELGIRMTLVWPKLVELAMM